MTSIDLEAYANQLAQINGRQAMIPVIEKELLHYEILTILEEAGLLSHLIFQGGTCLRLCYGGTRYSEDLDFVGGKDFSADDIASVKDSLEDALPKKYRVDVVVQQPKVDDQLVKKWRINVNTSPARADIPLQKISLEVAAVPAYTKRARMLRLNYEGLASSYGDTILYAESLDEIMADKLESFICSSHIRYRDIWDLCWLVRRPGLDISEAYKLRELKEADYHESKKFKIGLSRAKDQIEEIVESDEFSMQMKRFLPIDQYEETIGRPIFREFLVTTIQELYAPLS